MAMEQHLTYSFSVILTIAWGMLLWRDDFSTSSLEELLNYQLENRAWSKELRYRSNALVNSRLANEISQADYLTSRDLTRQDALECQRRAAILESQITRCTVRPLMHAS
jgi:hypothetical protein